MSNELAVKDESLLSIQGFLNQNKVKAYLEGILKDRAGQFITSLVSLASMDSKLYKCKPKSLMMCGLKAAALNLPLDNSLGFAWAIPYGEEAQFQLGYRGFIQLAMRTGAYRSLNVIDVREGELKNWDALTECLELQVPDDEKNREKMPIIGYAAMFELINGFKKVIYRKKDTLLAHGKRFSKAFKSGPWQSDTDAMCRKTLIKELLHKWGPLSTEIMEGIKADQAIIRETDTGEAVYEYVDNEGELEPPTYDINPETLEELNGYFDTLKINQAARSVKLAKCKGNPEEVDKLKNELREMLETTKEKTKEKDNPPPGGVLDKPPKEKTEKLSF